MLFDRAQLEEMTRNQLITLAVEAKVDLGHPAEGKRHLIDRLMLHSATEIPSLDAPLPALEARTEANPNTGIQCTIEQVKEACAPFILRGMKIFYDDAEKSWLFRYKLKPVSVRDALTGESRMQERWREDSGTLYQPLETIKRCANVLMQRAPVLTTPEPEKTLPTTYQSVA